MSKAIKDEMQSYLVVLVKDWKLFVGVPLLFAILIPTMSWLFHLTQKQENQNWRNDYVRFQYATTMESGYIRDICNGKGLVCYKDKLDTSTAQLTDEKGFNDSDRVMYNTTVWYKLTGEDNSKIDSN